VRIWGLYGLLILFLALWFALFKPYEVDRAKPRPTTISIEKFHYEEFGLQGKRLDLIGAKGNYDQRVLRIKKLLARDPERNESIKANTGTYDQRFLKFSGDVHYRSPKYRMTSQKADYDKKAEKLVVPVQFWLYAKDFNATGARLVYYKRSGKIEATKIDAKVLFR